MRLTIFQKGLLLVSVPLAFEIAFVSYLSTLLHHADLQTKSEEHAKDVILQADRMRRDWSEAAFASTIYAYNHNPVLQYKYKELLLEINDGMREMKKLCQSNPEQMQHLDKINAYNRDSVELLTSIQDKEEPLKALFPMGTLAARDHPFVKARDEYDAIIDEEQRVLDSGPNARRQNKAQIDQALWGAIGFNIVLTIMFTAYLARNITGRLQFVMINTRKMINRDELLPEVGGNDEIAELDRTLHRTADELAELEKFKRELTAMVTHELRTPLTSIQGVLTLLRVGALGEIPPLATEKVQMAEVNSQRLIRLINDLLDIEKMEAGKLELVPQHTALQPIIDQSISAVREFATQGGISIEASDTDYWVNADADRIVQVVINFLSNAIKYSEKNSAVTVATIAHGDTIEVRVIDRGRGIPPEFRDKVFDKFQQVDAKDRREKKGTGLGLAICKSIVEQHGGTIGVESMVGEGSTFWFTLPAAPKQPHQPSLSPASLAQRVGQ